MEKIREMLENFDTAMLVTQLESDLRARPMAVAHVEPNCDLWFFTGRNTAKVEEIEINPEVVVVFQKNHSRYLSVGGPAELISDRGRVCELWKESYRTWFPRGVEDPSLVLLRVRAREAEYWDNQGFPGVRYAFEAVKAYATGTTPEVREGEQHGCVVLR